MSAALALALAVDAAAADTEKLARLFIDACVKGHVRLTSDQAKPISIDRVPAFMMNSVSRESESRHYQLSDDDFMLVRYRRADAKPSWVKRCLVYGSFDRATAWTHVRNALTSIRTFRPVLLKDQNFHEITVPSAKAVVVVSQYLSYERMEVIKLDDDSWSKRFSSQGNLARTRSGYRLLGIEEY